MHFALASHLVSRDLGGPRDNQPGVLKNCMLTCCCLELLSLKEMPCISWLGIIHHQQLIGLAWLGYVASVIADLTHGSRESLTLSRSTASRIFQERLRLLPNKKVMKKASRGRRDDGLDGLGASLTSLTSSLWSIYTCFLSLCRI